MMNHFNSHKIDQLFSEASFIKKYVEVEKALALVQGNLGIIPKTASNAIVHSISAHAIHLKHYLEDFKKEGFPIVGLIKQLHQQVPNKQGEYLHWGATTQDVMDTGLVLLLRDFIEHFQKQLSHLIQQLSFLTNKHLKTPMVGRSQLQHAIPVSFGYKAATWLAPFLRHRKKIETLMPNVLKVQFGGAVGTLASLGERGLEVRKALAKELGLQDTPIAWHTQRDQLAEFITFLGVMSGNISKVAKDILYMTQSEVGEIIEKGGGKSSTMPNKRNPIKTQNVLVASKAVRSQMQAFLDTMVQDHERGSATWQMEWTLIPNICSQSYFALSTLNELLENIEVKENKMEENLKESGTIIFAEAIMMKLAKKLGRQAAHDLVDEAIEKSLNGITFQEALTQSEKIINAISKKEIEKIMQGKQHTNMAALMAKQVFNFT